MFAQARVECGLTREDVLAMTPADLSAHYRAVKIKENREEWRWARWMALFANANKGRGRKAYQPAEFFAGFRDKKKPPKKAMSPEEILSAFTPISRDIRTK